ncbi:MAG: lipopolysaccharide biosynthesis protein [Bacteroidales bacterium]|nr:lipopolysaccharide biosynthesis protein [Bacteroidales bacterium]
MGIVIRQSLKGIFVNYVGVLLGMFVQLYIVTKYFNNPEVYGLTKVIYEVSLLLGTLALLGSGSAGMRFFPYFRDEKSGNNGFLYYYTLFPMVGIVFFTIVYLVFRSPIEAYFGAKSALFNDYYYYVIPLMAVLALWSWGENYANINMRIAIPKAVREVGMRLIMVCIYLAFGFGLLGVKGLIVSFICGYGVCMLTTLIYSLCIGSRELRHNWSFVSRDLREKVVRYSGFLLLSTISGNLMSQLDIFMLAGVKGLYSAGVYAIVLYMAEVVNMPSRNISAISAPLAAKAMKEGNMLEAESLYKQVSIHQMLASTVLLLIVYINLDNIFAIIPNGHIYAEGKWAVLFLGFAKVIFGTLNFGNTLISFSRYYYWTLIVTIVLTFITIGTNLYFIPLYGLTGAALATLIATVLSYSYQQYLVQVKLRTNPFTWRHLRVVVLLVALFAINWLIPSFQGWSPWADCIIRTSIVCCVAVVLIYYLHISEQINWFIATKLLRRK